jgi:hypothetical protein
MSRLVWHIFFAVLVNALGYLPCMAYADDNKKPQELEFKDDFQSGSGRWETTDDASWELLETTKGPATISPRCVVPITSL